MYTEPNPKINKTPVLGDRFGMGGAGKCDRATAIAAIEQRFGNRCSRATVILAQHSHDESWHPPSLPDIVAYPTSTADVSDLVRIASQHLLPIVPFGTGSSMEGNVNPVAGGVSIDMRDLSEIISVDVMNADCRVQAGVTRKKLELHLRDTGLFFPVDPGADASLGGMAATRAAGTMTVKYGSMKDNVTGLVVVLSDGRIINTGGRARKSSSGYDLTRLFVGSEGTLGVITELILRLSPVPEATSVVLAAFHRFSDAVSAVDELMSLSIPLARIEYLDELEVEALNRFTGKNLLPLTTLILETHGSLAHQQMNQSLIEDVLRTYETHITIAKSREEQNEIWAIRHSLADAEKQLRPGCQMFVTDVAVPLSALSELIDLIRSRVRSTGLLAPIVGHIGDGNIHVTLLIDRNDPSELTKAELFHDWIVGQSLRLGGTATGEHGIGIGKRKYLLDEHGEGVEVMKTIKAALDPYGLLNPGKLFLD